MPRPRAYVQLGRVGDILNLLPLMWHLNRTVAKPVLCVAESNRSVVEGLDYIEPHYYPGHHDNCVQAASWMRLRKPGYDVVISQVWNNPDHRRQTDSYAKESWRLAGNHQDQHGMWPLVLQDSQEDGGQPGILFAGYGISSFLPRASELLNVLRAEFGNITVLDGLSKPRVADLRPMFERALCLVTIDTMHLHLARSTDVPVVALINDGWLGSVPPPNTVAAFRYSQVRFPEVVAAIRSVVARPQGAIIHAVDIFGQSERHLRARATWDKIGADCVTLVEYPRSAKGIGDARDLPYLKDLLGLAVAKAHDNDIVVWTGDDVSVSAQTEAWLRLNVARFGAVSARREPVHVGRDLFAFRADWLRAHWNEIPDYILGAPDFDMGLAALIRSKRGVKSVLRNMAIDFPGCEPKGAGIWHEPHKSEWMKDGHEKDPSVRHNRVQTMQWAQKYAQWMVFNPEGVMT